MAKNVRSKELREKLQESADTATKAAIAEDVKDLMVFVVVDISGSMEAAINRAKEYLRQFVVAFPLENLRVATFNNMGRLVNIQHASAAGVEQAFRGISAGGGTSHAKGVEAFRGH